MLVLALCTADWRAYSSLVHAATSVTNVLQDTPSGMVFPRSLLNHLVGLPALLKIRTPGRRADQLATLIVAPAVERSVPTREPGPSGEWLSGTHPGVGRRVGVYLARGRLARDVRRGRYLHQIGM